MSARKHHKEPRPARGATTQSSYATDQMGQSMPAPMHRAPAQEEQDFVDRVWAYIMKTWPERLQDIPAEEVLCVMQEIRRQSHGERPYITPGGANRARQIMVLFNGRNASEVARAIGCGRATVYRILKQHGQG